MSNIQDEKNNLNILLKKETQEKKDLIEKLEEEKG